MNTPMQRGIGRSIYHMRRVLAELQEMANVVADLADENKAPDAHAEMCSASWAVCDAATAVGLAIEALKHEHAYVTTDCAREMERDLCRITAEEVWR